MANSMEHREEDVSDLVGDSPLRGQRRPVSAERRSREADDREVVENREMSDDERFELFAKTLFNDVLPDLPHIPGYHVCWLSTNHQADTIPRRLRLGYQLIKAEEVPGFEFATQKSGEYPGCVTVNEMVAAKIPLPLYHRYMREWHHDEPNRQVEAIDAKIDALKGQAESDGGRIVEGDGMEELRRSTSPRGVFSD